ncbi:hypothetical protein EJ03DRAFT_326081 [Teratosphaeria nubilosa]|uniref:Uncharacterized protein n=1 Tax=Teratosphaeria nubilosa TaxID=161662 RepID=A0A6G1LD05_9PEZI|nr:hypothetical protein EJ03DRAFT_326081 [Teratosphaeria nubilosa]
MKDGAHLGRMKHANDEAKVPDHPGDPSGSRVHAAKTPQLLLGPPHSSYTTTNRPLPPQPNSKYQRQQASPNLETTPLSNPPSNFTSP